MIIHNINSMEKPELKRESGFIEIKGGEDSEKEEVLEFYKSAFDEQELKNFEREKTVEELKLIEQVNEKMKVFVERYGGQYLEIKPDNIHIIDADKSSKNKIYAGHYNPYRQEVVLTISSDIVPLELANLLIHEILHFNSFQSAILDKADENVLKHQRAGLDVLKYHGNEISEALFRDLNEAVNEELTKRFDKEFFMDFDYTSASARERSELIEDLRSQRPDIGFFDDLAYEISSQSENDKQRVRMERYPHIRERSYLWNLIAQINDKNLGKFKDEEEIFTIFANAAISGNLKPLALLMEATFGPGAFKKLGLETSLTRIKE